MAFTERYVSVAGGGAHDGTSEANAWTFAEMIAATPAAGTRANMKAGTYSVGATTLPANGTVSAPIVVRGYNSTIGDLDAQGRNANGTLNTTNFPAVEITAAWTPSPWCYLQNLNITGALSSYLITSVTVDDFGVISCSMTNTQNNASAGCLRGDDRMACFNSDFYCSGAAHGIVVDCDVIGQFVGCRFRGTAASSLLTLNNGIVTRCVLWGGTTSSGSIGIDFVGPGSTITVENCTFYNLNTCIATPNSSPNIPLYLMNNHATDSAKWIDNLHSATAAIHSVELRNRLRDITTPRTGVEAIVVGEVTTDTGGAETDYVDAASGDFYLISGAPGRAAGSPPNLDIGAYQHEEVAGGGHIASRVHTGM